ncbi:winged helix-turn-helix domain-containing protein [bacterium]|nr:winged helix-turn-helix domain-containing protein [bacterium]
MPTDRQPDLDPAEAELIRIKARVLARRGVIPRGDTADAEQDLALALLAARAGFDPARGGTAAFARTVVRRAAAKIARGRFAPRRHPGRVAPLAGPPAEPATLPGRPAAQRADLAIDLDAALAALPAGLRAYAEALKVWSPAEVARRTGVSRQTVYRRLRELAAALGDAGLGDYHPGAPDTFRARGQ